VPYVRMYALVVMDRICSYGVGDWWFWSPDTAEGVVSSSVSFSPPSHFPFFLFPSPFPPPVSSSHFPNLNSSL
jgi:hypothetical protein